MNLKEHLDATGTTQKDIAAEVGIDQSVMSRIVAGKIRPSLDVAFRIEAATGGRVLASSWAKLKRNNAGNGM